MLYCILIKMMSVVYYLFLIENKIFFSIYYYLINKFARGLVAANAKTIKSPANYTH